MTFLALALALFLAPSTAYAQGIATEPVLRVEAGMHTAKINRIDVDSGERYLVSGSDDKTLRVWSVDDGRLLQTLRVPIAEGNVGKVFAVAISPDGELIAAGGWGPGRKGDDQSIYIFERRTGQLAHQIEGLPNVITYLTFSPDGQHLVATLGDANGMRIFRAEDGRQIAEDQDYGRSSYWADFAQTGRLVTSSYDGKIRLYDPNFHPMKAVEAPGGERPFGIAFSPDGKRIAVGYSDTTRVNVLDGATLEPLFEADNSNVTNFNLGRPAWSQDGHILYAGGRAGLPNSGVRYVRRWSDGGRGAFRDVAVSEDTIAGVYPLGDGRIVFGAYDPSLGVIGSDGREIWRQDPGNAIFWGQQEDLKVSGAGEKLAFGFAYDGAEPAAFDLASRRLTLDPEPMPELSGAIIEMSGVDVQGWRYAYEPTLDGEPLTLKDHERSDALAIAPDGQRFVLGTSWYVRCFDREGDELWSRASSAVTHSVNITGNGRLAIAAFGDGTIRWYRMEDGEELLAFFPHADKRRWVVWTPEGYYMASPGGEELIGWQVNRGLDQAPDFYSASRFREQFNRPDIVSLVLEELDVEKAVARANAEAHVEVAAANAAQSLSVIGLPPVVKIVDPAGGTTVSGESTILTFNLSSEGVEPPQVNVHVDGQYVMSVTQASALSGDIAQQVLVSLAAAKGEETTISLIAEDDNGASDPAEVVLKRLGAAPATEKPRLFVLAIGVSDYSREPPRDLDFAAKDASDIIDMLKIQEGGLYSEVRYQYLVDEDADGPGILSGFSWLRDEVGPGDVVMVFFSGHGHAEGDQYYFLPHNVDIRTRDDLSYTAINKDQIRGILRSLYRSQAKVLAFLDTCYAGASTAGNKKNLPADVDRLVAELSSPENGVIVFSSSTGREIAVEDSAWENGAFTEALLEAFAGQAVRPGQRHLTVADLQDFLPRRVRELTDKEQNPQISVPFEQSWSAPILLMR